MKKLFTLFAAALLSVGMSWALVPMGTDTWDSGSGTLTVNSNPGSGAYFNLEEIKHLIISSSVTTIGDYAFSSCEELETVTCEEGLQNVGEGAFQACFGLKSVTLPASLTSIKDYAFVCEFLESFTINATTPPTLGGPDVFDSYASNLTIYVPADSENAYKEAEFWEDYADIINPIADVPSAIDEISQSQRQCQKHIIDGQLLIEKNGKFYNATGAEVK